jgi:hypothetical protein
MKRIKLINSIWTTRFLVRFYLTKTEIFRKNSKSVAALVVFFIEDGVKSLLAICR